MLTALIDAAHAIMTAQLVDSDLTTTREFWRLRAGATPAQAVDPRPFAAVLADGAARPE